MSAFSSSATAGRDRSCAAALMFLVLVWAPAGARAQEPAVARAGAGGSGAIPVTGAAMTRDEFGKVTMRAFRIDQPLEIDGRLTETIYETTPSASAFVQQEPRQGAPATEKTEVWLFFDGTTVYAAGRCWDSQPDRMVVNDMRRDGNITQNEHVVVTFDTFLDRNTGFYFQTSPVGALRDGLITDQRNANMDWNGVWRVKTARDETGWTFEMAIPFKTLRYPHGGDQNWGINFRRSVRWKNETSFLSMVPASFGNRGAYVLANSASLVGLEAPQRSRNLEVKPYVTGGLNTDVRQSPPLDNDLARNVGVDFKYGLTRGLISDITVNTDFAQVEADDQQINLGRANLLFPEKRDFFLEGQSAFTFAGQVGATGGGNTIMDAGLATTITPLMFFSRRIGLDDGAQVPIRAGARVAGRAGRFLIGGLNIQTGESKQAAGTEPTNFSVARVRRDIFSRSYVGVIATSRAPTIGSGGSNQVVGTDAVFTLYQNLTITGYAARSRTPGVTEGQTSYLGRFDYVGDRYGFNVERQVIGKNFSPEAGFLPRAAVSRSYIYGRFSPRYLQGPVRKQSVQTSLDYLTDPAGRLQSRRAQVSYRVDMSNGDQWLADYSRYYEDLTTALPIAGLRIAPGAYGFQEISTIYNFGPPRFFFGRIEFNRGTYYDGDRTILGANGRLNTGARLGIEPRLSLNWIDVSAGKVLAKVISTRTTFTMTPRMFVAGLVQYNSTSATLSSNIRFRWEYIPGSEFFLIYSDGRDTSPLGHTTLDNRSLAVKVTRMVRW